MQRIVRARASARPAARLRSISACGAPAFGGWAQVPRPVGGSGGAETNSGCGRTALVAFAGGGAGSSRNAAGSGSGSGPNRKSVGSKSASTGWAAARRLSAARRELPHSAAGAARLRHRLGARQRCSLVAGSERRCGRCRRRFRHRDLPARIVCRGSAADRTWIWREDDRRSLFRRREWADLHPLEAREQCGFLAPGFARHRGGAASAAGSGARLSDCQPWLRRSTGHGVNSAAVASSRWRGFAGLRCRWRNRRPRASGSASESMRSTPRTIAVSIATVGPWSPPAASCRWRGVRDAGGGARSSRRAEPQHDAGDGRHLIGFGAGSASLLPRRRTHRHRAAAGDLDHRVDAMLEFIQHRGGGSPNRPRPWRGRWPAPSRRAPPAAARAPRARRGPPPRSGRAPPRISAASALTSAAPRLTHGAPDMVSLCWGSVAMAESAARESHQSARSMQRGKPIDGRAPQFSTDRFALKLGLFYAAYFFFGGVQLPFFPLWLEARGLDARTIGLVIAVPMLVRIVATPIIAHAGRPPPGAQGDAGDRLGRRRCSA